jgi:hypothetical protein
MNGRLYDPVLGRMLSPDNNIQEGFNTQNYNRYSYVLNNPLKFNDPSGEFFTWSIGSGGVSVGFNLTPIGIPLGAGINVGFSGSVGVYGEVGYRVGGTGFGAGATISQSLDYDLTSGSLSTTTSIGAYASFGVANAGVNLSLTYADRQWRTGWGVTAGIGVGTDAAGIGLHLGYGSNGWNVGIGGYYDSKAWDSNPSYEPEQWNDSGEIQYNNNCYSYAIDDAQNPIGGKPQPGDYSGGGDFSMDLDVIGELAIRDGFVKKPTFLNKLGFGKKGYYEVYLVIDNEGGVIDYHWYRRDKGGLWSQKHGLGKVTNVDGSGKLISNPTKANHNYGGGLNYGNGGIILWVKENR